LLVLELVLLVPPELLVLLLLLVLLPLFPLFSSSLLPF
jgi:hypothetical protein